MFTINNLYFHDHTFYPWERKQEKQHSLLKAESGSTDTDETGSQKNRLTSKQDNLLHLFHTVPNEIFHYETNLLPCVHSKQIKAIVPF